MTGIIGSDIKKDKASLKKIKLAEVVDVVRKFCQNLDSEQLKFQLCCLLVLNYQFNDSDIKQLKSFLQDV